MNSPETTSNQLHAPEFILQPVATDPLLSDVSLLQEKLQHAQKIIEMKDGMIVTLKETVERSEKGSEHERKVTEHLSAQNTTLTKMTALLSAPQNSPTPQKEQPREDPVQPYDATPAQEVIPMGESQQMQQERKETPETIITPPFQPVAQAVAASPPFQYQGREDENETEEEESSTGEDTVEELFSRQLPE